ncbi:MAG: GNAT family N-acetyltransferase [Dehalococcoidia bacterium]
MSTEPHEPPIINIAGDLVALGPMRRELVPLYQRWINDFEVTRTLLVAMRPMTEEAEAIWFQGESTGRDIVTFTAYERSTLRPIGTTTLRTIDHRLRRADFGILIGEKDCWGKGYGTETTRLLLDYGFTALGLHNILLTTQSFNERAIRAYRRAGFREFGRRREAHWLGGHAYDVVYMDCLATEFESPVLHRLLPGRASHHNAGPH